MIYFSEIPVFDLVDPSYGYRGAILEDAVTVDFRPPIRALGDICSFGVRSDVPFTVQPKDGTNGQAEVFAKRALNCEKHKNYKFNIYAVSCDGAESKE